MPQTPPALVRQMPSERQLCEQQSASLTHKPPSWLQQAAVESPLAEPQIAGDLGGGCGTQKRWASAVVFAGQPPAVQLRWLTTTSVAEHWATQTPFSTNGVVDGQAPVEVQRPPCRVG